MSVKTIIDSTLKSEEINSRMAWIKIEQFFFSPIWDLFCDTDVRLDMYAHIILLIFTSIEIE